MGAQQGPVRIAARGLSLKIPNFIEHDPGASGWLFHALTEAFRRSRREYRTILDGLDFELGEGDRLAVLGRNGAGKTTLLRVLSGAFLPTSGALEMVGTRQALLNLGLGFNQNATVRENIYLRGTAMGLDLANMRQQADSILAFAGLADVANHRLLTLSSGQRMRLGFAISTSVQHDIMLLDEWFGAGDASFVKKARERLSSRVEGCKIMVLASHNLDMIRKTCSLGLVLDESRQVFLGPVEDAIKAYKKIYQALPGYVPRIDKKKAAARRKRRGAVAVAESEAAPPPT